jgi:uncharacterized membrane protein
MDGIARCANKKRHIFNNPQHRDLHFLEHGGGTPRIKTDITISLNDGATMVVANLQYSGIVFSAFFGLFLFGDQIPFIGWAGIFVIVLSAIAATALRARSVAALPVEEH